MPTASNSSGITVANNPGPLPSPISSHVLLAPTGTATITLRAPAFTALIAARMLAPVAEPVIHQDHRAPIDLHSPRVLRDNSAPACSISFSLARSPCSSICAETRNERTISSFRTNAPAARDRTHRQFFLPRHSQACALPGCPAEDDMPAPPHKRQALPRARSPSTTPSSSSGSAATSPPRTRPASLRS